MEKGEKPFKKEVPNLDNVLDARSVEIKEGKATFSNFINGGEPVTVPLESMRPLVEAFANGEYEDGVVVFGKDNKRSLIVTPDTNPAVLVKVAYELNKTEND